jgi:OOP family OmpA-OmpF porin
VLLMKGLTYFFGMKRSFWGRIGGALFLVLVMGGSLRAQSLTGAWQGVETEKGDPRHWPAVLRLQASKGTALFGVLYQEVGGDPETTVTFQVQGKQTGSSLRLEHGEKLNETERNPFSFWCDGSITFTYDASQEKLTGHATYHPHGECDVGDFVFYRIKLKSAATVAAGALSTLRVSGRDVRWYADAELTQPVATGNSFSTKLTKTTTFYLKQNFYPTAESPVVPITIKVTGSTQPASKTAPRPAAPVSKAPTPTPPADTAKAAPPVVAPPPPAPAPAPVVLPTVLFRQGTPELLPESAPALDKLAADLWANPTLRLRVVGHTDRLGESQKNQLLSEQRADAVRAYLVKAGIAASRLETAGYGDTRPLYPSPDIRNRRVEVEKLP